MGSYGDRWLKCKACALDGKCRGGLPDDVPCSIDIDNYGVMCELCYKSFTSAYPRLTVWWFEDKFPSLVAKMIERMAYPVWDTKD